MVTNDLSRSIDGSSFDLLDDSDANPKRRKSDEVNEKLVRMPLELG